MAYHATTEQLIEDFQTYYREDPMLWFKPIGVICWWGKVVEFSLVGDEMTLEVEGESITFLLP